MTDVNVHFKVDGNAILDTLTWEDMEILESKSMVHSRSVLAKFVTDDKGNPMAFDKAMKQLGQLKANEVLPVIQAFVNLWQVNPTTGDGSPAPSPKAEVPPYGGNTSVAPETGIASPGNSAESAPALS